MTRQYIFEFYKVIYRVTWRFKIRKNNNEVTKYIQGVFESCAEILITSCWLHVELGKNI
jgi:hypothetical protein